MASTTHDISRDAFMLRGPLARRGYDWWWHSFTARHAVTGQEKAFFVEFFCCNPALGGNVPVLGQLPANQAAGVRPSYVMVKAGCWGTDARQLHRFFGWNEVDVGRGAPFYVAMDDCICCETDLVGSVQVSAEDAAAHPEWMSDAGSMAWDLHLNKQVAFNVGYGASAPLRALNAFEMMWHAEGMKAQFEGAVLLDGERYVVSPKTSYGYADKNWGADFTSPWVWLASSNLVSRISGKRLAGSAFEIGGGRPKAFGIALERKLLGQMVYEGRAYEFNFSKPWTGSTTVFDCHETADSIEWHVEQQTFRARMVVDVSCKKAEMLLVNYESPDGAKRHKRLWNGGTGEGRVQLFVRQGAGPRAPYLLQDDMNCANTGCEYGVYE